MGSKTAWALICVNFHTFLRLRMSEATQLLPMCPCAVWRSNLTSVNSLRGADSSESGGYPLTKLPPFEET